MAKGNIMENLEINISNINEFIQLIRSIIVATGDPGNIVISIAFQIYVAGGIEAHAKTMLPDSIWMKDIYPTLILILEL